MTYRSPAPIASTKRSRGKLDRATSGRQRRTNADIINSDELHALWMENKPPVVHRMIERDVGSLLRPHAQDHHPEPEPISEAMTDPTRSS